MQESDLAAVQKRRMFPTRFIQRMQLIIQNNVIDPTLHEGMQLQAPLVLRLASRFPLLRRFPARLVGMGVRPEHVHTPQMPPVG